VATVLVGIPLLVLLWTLVLDVALLVVGAVDRVDVDALVAVAVVGAARILAYLRERTAHELAKAIPLSFAFLLLIGGALNLDQKPARILDRPEAVVPTSEMITFLLALEIGLRPVTDASQAALAAIRHRRGIDSSVGFWRTLWAAIRRPVSA
jgi:hypothetical protein